MDKYKIIVQDNNQEPLELQDTWDTLNEAITAAAEQLEFMDSPDDVRILIVQPNGIHIQYKEGMEIPQAPELPELSKEE